MTALITFLAIIVVGGIILKLIGASVRVIIGLAIAYFMFSLVFVWSPTEVMKNLHTDIWLTDEAQYKLERFLERHEERTEKQPKIIDAENIQQTMKDTAKEVTSKETREELKKEWLAFFERQDHEENIAFIKENYELLQKVFEEDELKELSQ